MTVNSCAECGSAPAPHITTSEQHVCEDCDRSPGTGFAVGGFVGMVEQEVDRTAERQAKLECTQGFWRRMWVRVSG